MTETLKIRSIDCVQSQKKSRNKRNLNISQKLCFKGPLSFWYILKMFVYRFIRLYRNVPHPLAPTVFSNRKKKKNCSHCFWRILHNLINLTNITKSPCMKLEFVELFSYVRVTNLFRENLGLQTSAATITLHCFNFKTRFLHLC